MISKSPLADETVAIGNDPKRPRSRRRPHLLRSPVRFNSMSPPRSTVDQRPRFLQRLGPWLDPLQLRDPVAQRDGREVDPSGTSSRRTRTRIAMGDGCAQEFFKKGVPTQDQSREGTRHSIIYRAQRRRTSLRQLDREWQWTMRSHR